MLPALTEATSSLLASDQVLAVPAAGPGDARRVPAPGRRGRHRRRARRAAAHRRRARIWSSFRSTSPTPIAPTASPTAIAPRGVFVALGGLHVTVAAGRSRGPRRRDLSSAPASRRFRGFSRTSAPAAPTRLPVDERPDTGPRAADPTRSDHAPQLPRAEFDRRHARLPAALRLLLQGRVLRGRPVVLHAARRRRAGGDRAAAGPASLLSRRPPARRSALRRAICSAACTG